MQTEPGELKVSEVLKMVGQLNDFAHIDTNATTQVALGFAILKGITINNVGTSWVVDIFDDVAGTDDQIASISASEIVSLSYNLRTKRGIKVVTTGTTPGSVTLIFEEGV